MLDRPGGRLDGPDPGRHEGTMTSSLDRFTETFAETLIAAIEKGVAPWQQPWKAGARAFPCNAVTNRTYRGTNLIMLLTEGCSAGYNDHRWAGFHQIRNAGGAVRRGEKGTPVLIWKEYKPDAAKAAADPDTGADETRIFCRVKYVFNVEQAEKLSLPALATGPVPADWETSRTVRQMVEDAKVKLVHGPDRACYSRISDTIEMPHAGRFETKNGYEHTLMHELAHCTAHPSRLDRPEAYANDRRSPEYAIEELRAEISAMLSGERLGIGHEPRDAHAYTAHWVGHLQNDPNAIRKATADAQRITDWLTRNIEAAQTEAAAA